MATPLSATARITVPYVTNGHAHKLHAYIRGLAPAGATFNHNSRATDSNDQVWTDSAQALYNSYSYLQGTDSGPQSILLEELVGGVWIVQAVMTPTASTHESGSTAYGWGVTLVLRDTAFKKIRVTIEEPNVSALAHYSAVPPSGNPQSFAKQWTSANTVTHAPYNWQVSRGNNYINTSPFVGMTVTPNRRSRRKAGLT